MRLWAAGHSRVGMAFAATVLMAATSQGQDASRKIADRSQACAKGAKPFPPGINGTALEPFCTCIATQEVFAENIDPALKGKAFNEEATTEACTRRARGVGFEIAQARGVPPPTDAPGPSPGPSQAAAEPTNQTAPPTSPGSAAIAAYPFVGDWYLKRRACPKKDDDTAGENKIVIKPHTIIGDEYACEAQTIRQGDGGFSAKSSCSSYEQKWSEDETFQVVDAKTLKLTIQGKSTFFYKCSRRSAGHK